VTRTLRGACIGYGFISEGGHSPSYRLRAQNPGDFEIVAVADITPARRAAAAKAYPKARLYDSWERLLDEESRNLDFVDITTPPYAHAEIAHAALDCRLHVLCEKPLAASAKQAQLMAAHAARAHRVLFPCHNYRHAPVVKAVRSTLAQGVIGKVRLVTLQTFRPTHAKGVVEWRPDWRREHKYSAGGIAMDHGSHTLYLAFEWLRSYPTSVTAKATTIGDFDTEDNFSCSLTFPTGIAVAHLTWTAGTRKVLYTLHGDRGAITVDDDEVKVLMAQPNEFGLGLAQNNGGSQLVPSHWMDASHREWFSSLLDDFRNAIESDQWVSADTIDSVMCMATIHTAYASAQQDARELPIKDVASLMKSSEAERAHRSPSVVFNDCASRP
jgi:predicted dehydrogenase